MTDQRALADERPVRVQPGEAALQGDLVVPRGSTGLVVFAHGSGSGRRSPRKRYVAGVLEEGGLGTLLFDLLTEVEEEVDSRTRHLRFDIPLLAGRLASMVDWLRSQPELRNLPVGLFGASTGAAAAPIAAARRPERVSAVVSRGGRLFEEPGTLEEVARLARDWFRTHLARPEPPPEAA